MKIFGGPFGHSAVKPLREHYVKIRAGAELLEEFITLYVEGRFEEAAETARRIEKLEEEADTIKDETRRHLSSSIFAAVVRPDVLLYLSTQDDIADHYTRVVSVLSMRRTKIVEELEGPLRELVTASLAVVFELGGMLESSGKGKGEAEADAFSARIPRLEHEAAEAETAYLKRLFSLESRMDPLSVMLLMEMGEDVLNMAKRARNACDILRRIVK